VTQRRLAASIGDLREGVCESAAPTPDKAANEKSIAVTREELEFPTFSDGFAHPRTKLGCGFPNRKPTGSATLNRFDLIDGAALKP